MQAIRVTVVLGQAPLIRQLLINVGQQKGVIAELMRLLRHVPQRLRAFLHLEGAEGAKTHFAPL